MAKYLTNAFSLNMLGSFPASVQVRGLEVADARVMAQECLSAVGHADTAAVFQDVLGIPVPAARITVVVAPGDTLLVGQYSGPRLPEGAHKLPEGATIKWLLVTIEA